MATCPYCKGHLTDGHRCPAKLRRYLVVIEIIASLLVGGFAGLLLLAAFDPRGQVTDMDAVAFGTGAILAVGINRFVRG
jgi:hypothetical protein